MAEGSFFQRLKQGLTKSRETWVQKIGTIFQNRQWDETSLDQMEENLITADVGIKATQKLMDILRRQSPNGDENIGAEMASRLQGAMVEMLDGSVDAPKLAPLSVKPWVILFLGVNGVGKTTTIGKLAAQFHRAGKKTLLVAGDTFRAAAVEQLDIWGQRVGVEVIKHRAGADPSAVVFDGIQAAKSRGVDVLLIDTAGRYQLEWQQVGVSRPLIAWTSSDALLRGAGHTNQIAVNRSGDVLTLYANGALLATYSLPTGSALESRIGLALDAPEGGRTGLAWFDNLVVRAPETP
jgi:flagellar biosynthesis GTPase FlhF